MIASKDLGTADKPLIVKVVSDPNQGPVLPDWLTTGFAIVASVSISYFVQQYLKKKYK